jgi:uncharacterized protein (TIGR02687 family)
MNERIAQALIKQFDRDRVIFWYDSKQELRDDFESLELDRVIKIELKNNEFAIKYRVLREQPKQKFLIYHEGAQPADIDNWLLDVQLAYGQFRTDQVAMLLADLELGLEFAEVIQAHTEFFQATKRKDSLKRSLTTNDTQGMLRLKMLAVCASSDPRLDAIVEQLLAEHANDQDTKIKLINRCGLDSFLWEQMQRIYGYISAETSIKDFAIQLFKYCYFQNFSNSHSSQISDGKKVGSGEWGVGSGKLRVESKEWRVESKNQASSSHFPLLTSHSLSTDAIVFLKRWKDSRQFAESFEKLSYGCAEFLNIEQDLHNRDLHQLIELDYFLLIDQKILNDLVHQLTARTISLSDITSTIYQRRTCHWYDLFRDAYECINFAAQFIYTLAEANLSMDSIADGIQKYSQTWFRLDQYYRKVIYHSRSSNSKAISDLKAQIENLYTNNYLLKLSDRWQTFIDAAPKWEAIPIPSQRSFYERWVLPFLNRDNKICVIISDAMRYEIGDEFLSLIRQEDRYEATLEPALSMLPSYTQLGMAALLPNTSLAIADNETGHVLVNGQPSNGTANRDKILKQATGDRARAIAAEDLIALNRDESRELLKANDAIYIYHNRIDHTGDKLQSEGLAFEAAESTLKELIQLVKKLTAANANNILLTADHGFIYQNQDLDRSDFLSQDVTGQTVLYRDRRFVLGKNLDRTDSVKFFDSNSLGLAGDIEVCIPKSINRLRLKGAGSRFVHGGATLQEITIPVIKINKKRQSDISSVEVEILRGSSSTITSGQLAVTFYQVQPTTDKVRSRYLRAGIYTQSGDLISDSHDLNFDLASENPRERELQVRFLLTKKADEANNQEVILRLEEKLSGTTHYQEYKSIRYLIRRSFSSDFDF